MTKICLNSLWNGPLDTVPAVVCFQKYTLEVFLFLLAIGHQLSFLSLYSFLVFSLDFDLDGD